MLPANREINAPPHGDNAKMANPSTLDALRRFPYLMPPYPAETIPAIAGREFRAFSIAHKRVAAVFALAKLRVITVYRLGKVLILCALPCTYADYRATMPQYIPCVENRGLVFGGNGLLITDHSYCPDAKNSRH